MASRNSATSTGRALYAAYEASSAPVDVSSTSVDKNASAFDALDRGLTAFCKAQNIARPWTAGLERYRETAEGRALLDNYNASMTA